MPLAIQMSASELKKKFDEQNKYNKKLRENGGILNFFQATYAGQFLGVDLNRCVSKTNPYKKQQLIDFAVQKAKKFGHDTKILKTLTKQQLCSYLASDEPPPNNEKFQLFFKGDYVMIKLHKKELSKLLSSMERWNKKTNKK